jgi:hypothetical protein
MPEGPSPFCVYVLNLSSRYNPEVKQTNDFVHILRLDHYKFREKVVASVLEMRTEFNYVHYDFFLNLEGIVKKKSQNP